MSSEIDRRARTRRIGAGAILALALLIGGSGCAIPKHPIESARLLREVAGGREATTLRRRASEPTVEAITYTIDGRRHAADLYLPPDRAPEAGIVLVPGIAKEGRRDSRLVGFARSLARARFAVLVPDIPTLRRLKVRPEDARQISDAFRHLVSRPELAQRGRTGIAAASYAVGPAVLAALDPAIREHVGFVLGVGGYYDLEEVLTFAITGYYRDRTKRDPRWQHLEPSHYGKWIFLLSNLDYIPNAHDRELLREITLRKLHNPAAPVDALAARLSKQGHAYYQLVTARQPERIPELIARLAPAVQRRIAGLNLAQHDLSKLRAQLILIHGRNDQMIPYTESKALVAAVPEGRLFLVNNLAHVDLGKGGLPDAWQLLRAVDELLAHR